MKFAIKQIRENTITKVIKKPVKSKRWSKIVLVLLSTATLFCGCSSAPYQVGGQPQTGTISRPPLVHQPHPDYQIKHIPLSSSWQDFRCREGTFSARFADGGRKTVQVRYLGQEQLLQHSPSADPVIYENRQLAIFADETQIILARPMSTQIILSGCQRAL